MVSPRDSQSTTLIEVDAYHVIMVRFRELWSTIIGTDMYRLLGNCLCLGIFVGVTCSIPSVYY